MGATLTATEPEGSGGVPGAAEVDELEPMEWVACGGDRSAAASALLESTEDEDKDRRRLGVLPVGAPLWVGVTGLVASPSDGEDAAVVEMCNGPPAPEFLLAVIGSGLV